MIRFIIKRKFADHIAGYSTEGYETVDLNVSELEGILCGGGSGENGYDIRELFACEVLPQHPASEGDAEKSR